MKKRTVYICSFLLPMLLILIAWAFNDAYPFGNKTLMAVDFGFQYIDLFAFMRRAILTGDWTSLAYSFSKSLGGTTVGIWAYYLLSPFNLVYLFFDKAHFPAAIVINIILRYGSMGLAFAYFLMKRYPAQANRRFLIPIFATIYALNGFNVSYQLNTIFFDVLITLPLILVGLEELLDGQKPWKFCFFLALSVVMQFYMAYMACIFIVFYTVYYVLTHQDYLEMAREKQMDLLMRALRVAKYAILSVGVVSIIVMPVLFNLIYSKGQLQSGMVFEFKFQIKPLEILSKFMIGAFDNNSWSAGPNLPNIYVASLGLIGSVYFFISDQFSKKEKAIAGTILFIFFISICHLFTNKIWHMGQTPAGFFYRFSWLIAFYLVFLAYRAFREQTSFRNEYLFGGLIIIAGIFMIVNTQNHTFLADWQLYLSIALMAGTLVILMLPFKYKWAVIALITCGELVGNAYLSQKTLNYIEAPLFSNVVTTMEEGVDLVRPNSEDFYRINTLFTRSKNDPFMQNFPGMTNFSSSLEQSTRDIFDRFGSNGINAATTYNGNTFLDAIFGIRYVMEYQPLNEANKAKYYGFYDGYTREDITAKQPVVKQTPYFKVFETPTTLPIAYGINAKTANVQLVDGQPITNQNKILQAMSGEKTAYFKASNPEKIVISNIAITKVSDTVSNYSLKDSSKTGLVKFEYTPKDNQAVALFAPTDLSFKDTNQNSIALSGVPYAYIKKFTSPQLFNLAVDSKGKKLSVELTTKTQTPMNLGNLLFVEEDGRAIKDVIAQRQKQGMKVKEWSNNKIKGQVSITDDSQYLMTSIPYDKGWKVKVDGHKVETKDVWRGFLAVPIEKGKHEITMTFIPPGLYVGAVISLVSLLILVMAIYRTRYDYEEEPF